MFGVFVGLYFSDADWFYPYHSGSLRYNCGSYNCRLYRLIQTGASPDAAQNALLYNNSKSFYLHKIIYQKDTSGVGKIIISEWFIVGA